MEAESKQWISTEKLIQAVKKRPALYSKENQNYHLHGKYRGRLWKEVCREVFSDWCNLSPQKRIEYAHDLQRRWKNVRSCFTRELKLQRRKQSSGDPDYKRKKTYIYFDQLTFLMNPNEVPEEPDVKVPLDDDEEDSSDPLETEMFHLPNDETTSDDPEDQHHVEVDEEPHVVQKDDTPKQTPSQISDFRRNEAEDEDKQFVLSIVPALRKLTETKKFDAKIEILKVLKRLSTGDGF